MSADKSEDWVDNDGGSLLEDLEETDLVPLTSYSKHMSVYREFFHVLACGRVVGISCDYNMILACLTEKITLLACVASTDHAGCLKESILAYLRKEVMNQANQRFYKSHLKGEPAASTIQPLPQAPQAVTQAAASDGGQDAGSASGASGASEEQASGSEAASSASENEQSEAEAD